ncbi:hypothetical protein ACH4UM_36350 [Streptomyces sp. NPDC020801]
MYGPQGPLISNDEVAEFVGQSDGRLRGLAGAARPKAHLLAQRTSPLQ